jgi:hypothetical protein
LEALKPYDRRSQEDVRGATEPCPYENEVHVSLLEVCSKGITDNRTYRPELDYWATGALSDDHWQVAVTRKSL